MNRFESEKTPQTGANAGGQLYEAVDQGAQQQQGQPQIHQGPEHGHASQARLGYSVAHDSLHRVAFEQSFPHACMVTNTRTAA